MVLLPNDPASVVNGSRQQAPAAASTTSPSISMRLLDVSTDDLSTTLSQLAQREIIFTSDTQGERYSVHAADMPLDMVLSQLNRHGAVAWFAPGENTLPGNVRLDTKVNLQGLNIRTARLAKVVALLSGERARFIPQDAHEVVSLEVKDLPLRELLVQLTALGQVELDGVPLAASR